MAPELDSAIRRLERLGPELGSALAASLKGVEKESLRVTPDGRISRRPHPPALGSALTHPYITTDYSEALLEFVTPPAGRREEVLRFLLDLHVFTCHRIGDELLWAASMPCLLEGEASIPIARYGTSNSGRMRHVYRQGLAWRYGKAMQVIAGVHFNFSLLPEAWRLMGPVLRGWPRAPLATVGAAADRVEGGEGGGEGEGAQGREALDEEHPEHIRWRARLADAYFGLIRNVLRHGWLVPYLFGASPALCRSFLTAAGEGARRFEAFDPSGSTLYAPWATSLRMSDIGYTNRKAGELAISYDGLEPYVRTLSRAIQTPFPPYEQIGVRVEGEYRQLNANLLQMENEYYSPVRPKQPPARGERPTVALSRKGVRYVEVRTLDLDPFAETGLREETLAFMELFLLFCAIAPSPPMGPGERHAVDVNLERVAVRGREPGLELETPRGPRRLREWGQEVVRGMRAIAALPGMEAGRRGGAGEDVLERALRQAEERLADPEATPSARVLREMRAEGLGFFEFALRQSHDHAERLRARRLEPATEALLERLAAESLEAQRALEESDAVDFETYLERYFRGAVSTRLWGAEEGEAPAPAQSSS